MIKVSLHLRPAVNTDFSTGVATAMQQAEGGKFQYVQR